MIATLTRLLFTCALCSLINLSSYAQKPDKLIDSLIQQLTGFKQIINNPDKYDLQIIFTEIKKDANGTRSFKTHEYRTNLNEYFYCASIVKLPTAAFALEKAESFNINKDWTFTTDSISKCHHRVIADTSSQNKKPSLANYIKRMLLVSDNVAFDRTLDFVTLEYENRRLQEMGFTNSHIYHNFDAGCSDRSTSRPVTFFDESETTIYTQKATTFVKPTIQASFKKGKAFYNENDKLIKTPKNYSNYNYLRLTDVNDILKAIVLPTSVTNNKRFNISENNRAFLLKYLKLYPSQAQYPRYTKKQYPDKYKKYLILGDGKFTPDSTLSIYNIVGQSYGDLSDCAYVVDAKNNVEFILAAAIYCNKDEIINDGKYEYNTLGLPFFAALGRLFLNYAIEKK